MQKILKRFDSNLLPIYGVDGLFGPETKQGVISFQSRRSITPTGSCDGTTTTDQFNQFLFETSRENYCAPTSIVNPVGANEISKFNRGDGTAAKPYENFEDALAGKNPGDKVALSFPPQMPGNATYVVQKLVFDPAQQKYTLLDGPQANPGGVQTFAGSEESVDFKDGSDFFDAKIVETPSKKRFTARKMQSLPTVASVYVDMVSKPEDIIKEDGTKDYPFRSFEKANEFDVGTLIHFKLGSYKGILRLEKKNS